MTTERKNINDVYNSQSIIESIPNSIQQTETKIYTSKRDMIYTDPAINIENNSAYLRKNKKVNRKKYSPITIILILISIAIGSVLYIDNILSVGRLVTEINRLQIKHKQNISEQELLKAKINRLSSLDRIQQIAIEQLQLKKPKSLPVWIEIDQNRIKEVEAIISQKTQR